MTDQRLDIIATTTKMGWYADQRRWEDLHDIFTDTVTVDYTSLTGGEPADIPAADLINGWKAGLDGLDATQHHISNHLVTLDGDDTATVTAQFIATHRYPNPHGEPLWTLGGHYLFTLHRADDGWRIAELTMTATWASGNQHIMTLAAGDAR